jgi:hypothetical protein
VSAPSIAASWLTDANHVRKVIREFTSGGFDSLRHQRGRVCSTIHAWQ